MDYEEVALFATDFLLKAYPEAICQRYQISERPKDDVGLLEAIGKKRGALRAGGRIDFHKASELVLHEFRSGKIGQLSLETPAMAVTEKYELSIMLAEKEAKKQALLEQKKRQHSGKRH